MRTLIPFPKSFREWFGCLVSIIVLFIAFYVSVWLLSHYTPKIIDWLTNG